MQPPKLLPLLVSLLGLLLPLAAGAAGAHDKLQCAGCHAKKEIMTGNKTYLDPATGQPFSGSTAVCLACHQTADAGGQGAYVVNRHDSHPFGLAAWNPKKAKIPGELLVNGRMECLSCHDPHPSNTNYKYLRMDCGEDGRDTEAFCGQCHPRKTGIGVQAQ
jgi:predicted CXXCH cytochrome family protein